MNEKEYEMNNLLLKGMNNFIDDQFATIEKQKEEIGKLTAESTEWESKFYNESKKVDNAIEYLESYNTDFKNCKFGEAPISIRELGDLLDILKGKDKE